MNALAARLRNLTDRARLFAILVIGTVMRFATISHSSIWHDEGFTMMLAVRNFSGITEGTASDVHPPLYYYFLHVWIMILGTSALGARSMSAVFSLATVAVVFFLVRRLYSRDIAALAAFFAAIAPIMIRFSQEARMYAMVAFLVTAGTYVLIRAMEHPKHYRLWWLLYASLMLAGVYTHYYAFLVLLVHWIYVFSRTSLAPGRLGFWPRLRAFLMQGWWWTANALIFILFIPWVPILINQITRVNNSFWIQPQWITINTVPDSIYTFLAYIHLDSPFPQIFLLRDIPFALIVVGIAWAVWHRWKARPKPPDEAPTTTWREGVFFLLYFLLPLALVWVVSKIGQPVYLDRYFVFAAVGFYIALSLGIMTVSRLRLRRLCIALVVVAMIAGNVVVYVTVNHKMRVTGAYVNDRYQQGDEIISLDPFTYFDFTYYNHTGYTAKLYGPTLNFTYDEPGLLAARQKYIQVYTLKTVHPTTGRVWIIGKTGSHSYYQQIPASWQLVAEHKAGYTEARLYKI